MFNVILIEKDQQHYQAKLQAMTESQLPQEEVLVKIDYSTLNYKDALAITGKSPVVRQLPMVAGIDCVGTVLKSQSDAFNIGDQVLLNGWGVGEKYWGGLAELGCFKAQWLIPLPKSLSPQQAMLIGTAGYTAMLSVMALQQQGITPSSGKILVTGATGGVGSFAVAILAQLGYEVIASTGKTEQADWLRQLGAREIIARQDLAEPAKHLMKERWIGVIDSVGSHTLANACASTQYGGVVTCCGLAQGMDFPATVAPFILRGIRLIGIDSVMCPKETRLKAWQQLSQLDLSLLNQASQTIHLEQAIDYAYKLLNDETCGRVVVEMGR